MAGIAALMRTRKERERKRQEIQEESLQLDETGGFSEVIPGRNGNVDKSKTLKKTGTQQSLVKKKIEKQVEASTSDSNPKLKIKSREKIDFHNALLTQSYTPVYLGFVFISIGLVITFVGLGDKGFRTVELRLIGPTLCCFGLSCILFKIIQCHFPKLCTSPYWLKRARMGDSDNSNLVEKGIQNGHFGNNSRGTSPQVLSPRVILQSSKQIPRPKSAIIPNYIEDSSDEETDFDRGGRDPHPHPRPPIAHEYHSYDDKRNTEIILDPKTLMATTTT